MQLLVEATAQKAGILAALPSRRLVSRTPSEGSETQSVQRPEELSSPSGVSLRSRARLCSPLPLSPLD